MVIALLLLAGLYVVLIAVLIAAGLGVVAVALIAVILALAQYFSSQALALAAIGAREVSDQQAPELHAIVEKLCVTARLPMPRLAIVSTELPTAFTVGRTPSSATVCTTSGLMELLEPAELEAVLAHELTHIITRDVMVMTIGSFFASIAAFIARLRPFSGRAGRAGRDHDDDRPPFFATVIVSGMIYVVSYVVIQALSRAREFTADRGSATITGRPDALRTALEKIAEHTGQMGQPDLRGACGEMAALSIIAPDLMATVATLFATHPPLPVRLETLAELEAELPAGV
jgi:heat shock protein HtpX